MKITPFRILFLSLCLLTIGSLIFLAWASQHFGEPDLGYTYIFTPFQGPVEERIYNLTDEHAREVPGNLPQVLLEARTHGTASLHFATDSEAQAFEDSLHASEYVHEPHRFLLRYQGMVYHYDLTPAP